MNAAAINMSRVSNGLIASQLKSAEALSNEGLHFFNQIFRLNWSTARESLDIHLSCFGKILHENNLDRSNEIIVDHIKLVPKHVTGYMCDIAELGKKIMKESVGLQMWRLQRRWRISAIWLRVW